MTPSLTSAPEPMAMLGEPAEMAGARVFPIPPPAYFGAAFAAAMVLQRPIPLDLHGRPATTLVGSAILVAGLVLDVAGVASVVVHRTTIVPHRPVATWWPLLTLPLAVLAVQQLAIKPEETYLGERYGSVYDAYRRRVRRWL